MIIPFALWTIGYIQQCICLQCSSRVGAQSGQLEPNAVNITSKSTFLCGLDIMWTLPTDALNHKGSVITGGLIAESFWTSLLACFQIVSATWDGKLCEGVNIYSWTACLSSVSHFNCVLHELADFCLPSCWWHGEPFSVLGENTWEQHSTLPSKQHPFQSLDAACWAMSSYCPKNQAELTTFFPSVASEHYSLTRLHLCRRVQVVSLAQLFHA